MIAVILAAGRGSRLNNYTSDVPKSLLPLNEKTILDYNIDLLESLGVNKIIIVTGYMSAKIEKHTNTRENIECVYNPFWQCCNVLGSLYIALPYIKEDFLFLHADTLVGKEGWNDMIQSNGDVVLPYQSKLCGEEEMKVRIDKNGNLLEINKSMEANKADGEFLGIAKFKKNMVDVFQKESKLLFENGDLNHYMEAVISNIIGGNFILKTYDIGSIPFVEIDFEEDYLKAKALFNT